MDTTLATLDISTEGASPMPFCVFHTSVARSAFRGSVNGDQTCLYIDGLNRPVYPIRYEKFARLFGNNVLMERETMDRRGNGTLGGTIFQVAPDNTETVLTSGTSTNGR